MNQLHTEPINRRNGVIDSSRLRQCCQLSLVKAVPSRAPARRAGVRRDCLKINYAHMKTTELNYLRKLVKAGENRPLPKADMVLLLRLRFALAEYDGEPDPEPRCLICKEPEKHCRC